MQEMKLAKPLLVFWNNHMIPVVQNMSVIPAEAGIQITWQDKFDQSQRQSVSLC